MPEIRAKRICHTFCNTQCGTGYAKETLPPHHSTQWYLLAQHPLDRAYIRLTLLTREPDRALALVGLVLAT